MVGITKKLSRFYYEDKDLQKIFYFGVGGLLLSAISIVLFTLVAIYTAPAWLTILATGLFVASAFYLGGLLYGVINDLFATKMNLSYFLLGHQPSQFSLFKSNKRLVQAIGWGITATSGLSMVAGIIFGIATAVTAIFFPVATFVIPLMLLCMPLVAFAAERFAQNKVKSPVLGFSLRNPYQEKALATMRDPDNEATWLANGYRNALGYLIVPVIGLGTAITIITLSTQSFVLPAILFSATFAAVMPIGFLAVVALVLIGAAIYAYVNRNKTEDNKYRLYDEFDTQLSEEMQLPDSLESTADLRVTDEPSARRLHFRSPISNPFGTGAIDSDSHQEPEEISNASAYGLR